MIGSIADKGKTIKRYNVQNENWELIAKYQTSIYGVAFDVKNIEDKLAEVINRNDPG